MYADTHPAIIHQLGGMGVRRRAGVLVHELGDGFFFTAVLSAAQSFNTDVHTVICRPIHYNWHLLTVSDS